MIQNDYQIYVNVVSDETVHHDAVIVLNVFIWLVVWTQHPVCEEVHVERDVADHDFVEHL